MEKGIDKEILELLHSPLKSIDAAESRNVNTLSVWMATKNHIGFSNFHILYLLIFFLLSRALSLVYIMYAQVASLSTISKIIINNARHNWCLLNEILTILLKDL